MLETLKSIFEFVANNFYKKGIKIDLTNEADTAYCVGDRICLPIPLLEKFTQDKLPRFTVFYHELGHALYSERLTKFIEKWENLPSITTLSYKPEYHHLLNWIEDFYIEDRIVKDYSYLKDIVGCLKQLTFNYDITAIDKAFNHYYLKGCSSPSLNAMDGFKFSNYLKTLISYRQDPAFGITSISLLTNKSINTKFIKTFVEFYDWCVNLKILDGNVLPPLSNPINIINNTSNTNNANIITQQSGDNGGTITDHTHLVGGCKEVFPDIDVSSTAIFVDQFTSEQKMIKEKLANRSQVQSTNKSLDGLFTTLFKDTSIIQNKVIVKNFFNPNRLVDGVLFKMQDKAFNNVSIYRDISGSTSGNYFELINNICKYLFDKIPIAKHFYLYASGNISILETEFEDWPDYYNKPDLYSIDPVFQQMEGGTNSGAIADVITEQLNDKWLNIVVTDGDLDDLFDRDNIGTLLSNIFIISIGNVKHSDKIDPSHLIYIKDDTDIDKIASALLNMKGEH